MALEDQLKICTACLDRYPETSEFFYRSNINKNGLNPTCKTCAREKTRNAAQTPKAKERAKGYYQTNKAQNRAARAEYARMLRADPMYRITSNLRRANAGFIKSKGLRKSRTLNQYLGCSPLELKSHLEVQFQPGMTWDNYGFGMDKWNIDHRIPLASASDIDGLYRLSHYTNLQPMWQPDNISKRDSLNGASVIGPISLDYN